MKLSNYFLVIRPLLIGPSARAVMIDLEGLSDSEVRAGQFLGLGVAWQNAIALRAGISLNEFDYPPHSGANVASDSGGGIHNGNGVDVSSAIAYKGETGQLEGFKGGEPITNDELLLLDCDVLAPCALEQVISDANAGQIKAKLILGGELPGGVEVTVKAGDLAVLPCGTGHCRVSASSDFLVIGAYTLGQEWDLCRSAPEPAAVDRMKKLPFPAQGALTRTWR